MKKFLCYDTNDAASGKIGVNSNGVLKPDATVPSINGAANQQLVTDEDGNVKWEDKLTYVTHEWVDWQLPNTEEDNCVITNFTLPEVGQTVLVKLDGVESIETVKAVTDDEHGVYTGYIGSIDPVSLQSGGSGWCIYGFRNDYGFVKIFGGQSVDKVIQSVSLYCSIIHKINPDYLPIDGYVRSLIYYATPYLASNTFWNEHGLMVACRLCALDSFKLPRWRESLIMPESTSGIGSVAYVGNDAFAVNYCEFNFIESKIEFNFDIYGINEDTMVAMAKKLGFTLTSKPTT